MPHGNKIYVHKLKVKTCKARLNSAINTCINPNKYVYKYRYKYKLQFII